MAKVCILKNGDEDFYPVTSIDAIYMQNGSTLSSRLSSVLSLDDQLLAYEQHIESLRAELIQKLNDAGVTYDNNASVNELLGYFYYDNSALS